ncbi:unnamed protein product [Effrenium voratum]|uniref:WW domain-containing protein n=1 Tax=Effrenium voratum TaxID=2562239 RepID=A0AA36JQ10_9DINO|nr:unnamed protein product [Effrenium voratum]CAJ1417774.1 unnamed protein product [Effrenium voratum]
MPWESRHLQFADLARQLGLEDVDRGSLPWMVAHHMLELPLPPEWSEELDFSGQPYYFHSLTGDTSCSHPLLGMFKSIIAEVAAWPQEPRLEEAAALAGRHLQRAHGFAFQELLRWSGPHSIEAGRRPDRAAADHRDVYFCNLATGECSRENPHAMLDFELRQRRSLLSRCLAAFPPSKSEGASQGSTDAEEGSEREMSPAIRVFAPDSKPHLVLPPRGLSGCLSQASQRAYGDESCKSQASFYSATSAEEAPFVGQDPERPSLASGEPGAFVTAC